MLSKCCDSSSGSFEKFTTFGNYIYVNFKFRFFYHTTFDVQGLMYHYLGSHRLAEKTLRDAAKINPYAPETWYVVHMN